MEDTIFDKIIRGEIPSDKIYEDEKALAFKDINPGAPTHILVIPKGLRIVNLLDATEDHKAHLGHLLYVAAQVAKQEGLEESGFRLAINNGAGVGQSVFYLHLHVLGGRSFSWPPG